MSYLVELAEDAVFEDWQPYARFLLTQKMSPEAVHWQCDNTDDLFSAQHQVLSPEYIESHTSKMQKPKVPRAFVKLAHYVCCHKNEQRFELLYRLLWRIQHENRQLLFNAADKDVRQAQQWAKHVGREKHKMKAFIRFRRLELRDSEPTYIAWFEPEHYSLKLATDFFCDRFYSMQWSILTPYLCAHWHKETLTFTPGCGREQAPEHDQLDTYWQTYYTNIFNPARLKVKAMCSEMPKKYWHNLPEAKLIKPLINQAENIKQDMIAKAATEPKLKEHTRYNRAQWLKYKSNSDT